MAEIIGVNTATAHDVVTGLTWSSVTGIVYDPQVSWRKGRKRQRLTQDQIRIIMETVPGNRGEGVRLAREWGVSAAAIRAVARGERKASKPVQSA